MHQLLDSLPALVGETLQKRGFTALTPVQEQVLSDSAIGGDLRISSQTGSGKTVAIGLVLARDWGAMDQAGAEPAKGRTARPKALVVAPTRELANQVYQELSWLLKPLGVNSICVTGGTNLSGDRRALSALPDLVVGTPGRICDHLRGERLDLSQIHTLVLDEADQMLDLGFREELDAIFDAAPERQRTHFVSATFRNEVGKLAARYQSNANHVQGTPLGAANADIEHVAHVVRESDVFAAVVNLLLCAGQSRTLIFARTRQDVADLTEQLTRRGFRAAAISGDLPQAQRERALSAFRRGSVAVLIATDVASRGIHVEDIDLVIQAEAPRDPEVFVHRSGRTGRAGNKGRNVLLVPDRGLRRVERMLAEARVKPKFQPIPNATEVARVQEAEAVARFTQLPEEVPPLEERFTQLAQRICETADPQRVIATLLGQSGVFGPCSGMDIESPPPPARRANQRGLNGGAGRKPFPERAGAGQRPARHNGSYVPFFINWGRRHGATTNRLLSMACRRGDVQSDVVGSIRIGDRSSVIEVQADVAKHFASSAGQPDARDPKIKISSLSSPKGVAKAERPPAAAQDGTRRQERRKLRKAERKAGRVAERKTKAISSRT